MAPPITTWPGFTPPAYHGMSPFDRMPMFGGDNGPRYTGPMNVNSGSYGPLLQALAPQLLQMLMGNSHMPTQFFPEQNVYDQIQANKFYEANQKAMAVAARRDTGAIENTIGGITQMMTGQPLTDVQQARNHRIAGGISQYMPILTQLLGPDLIDQLHGSRGSATIFAQQIHQAMRTSVDPVTGGVGYSGESAGRLAQETFEQLFGQGADIGAMKGMSAGQAGMLVNELQTRGMLGQPLGTLPIAERRSRLPRSLTDDVVNRLAEQLPEVQKIVNEGGTPNDDVLSAACSTIRSTHSRLTDPTAKLTEQDIEKLPGASEIIRAGDADRIKQRLGNLSGAVKAMRDIFGDMGNPNAPMREIMNGLDALTQGGMATMSPGELEMMVRKTHSIAKQTGIGMEGMIALTTQNAGLADQLGLDRSFAVSAAQQSALFGAAAGDRLRLDMPAWGALTKEQLTLGDDRLRMHAAASPLANQLNAAMRLADSGMATPAEGTELASFFKAVREGQSQYDFGGEKRDIVMPHARFTQMLERDAGVKGSEAYAVLMDTTGNQEFGQRYNTTNTVRRVQTNDAARRMLQPTVGNRIRGVLADDKIDELLQAEGVVKNQRDFRTMMQQVSGDVSRDFFKMSNDKVRTQEGRQKALGESFRARLTENIGKRMPQADQEEIDAVTNKVIEQMGGQKSIGDMGTVLEASINALAASHPQYKSIIGLHNLLSQDAMAQAESRGRQAEVETITTSAMAGLGAADPVRRIVDVFQNAKPDTTLKDAMIQAMGGVSNDVINAADPQGGLAQVFGLVKQNNALNPNDPAHLTQIRQNAGMIRGLVEGGEAAAAQMRLLDASRDENGKFKIGNDNLYRQLEFASKRGSDTSLLGDLGYQLSAKVSTSQVKATNDRGDLADKLWKEGKLTEESKSTISSYVQGARERGRQLLDDERSMMIIGRGGLELVHGAISQSDKLQELAAEQSKKLGRTVDISELMLGGKGIDKATQQQAGELFNASRKQWAEIEKRRNYGMLPGKGDDPANKRRAAMTEQEKEDLEEQKDFVKRFSTAESRAAEVMDRLAKLATPEQRDRMNVDVNRESIIKAITEGDRGISLNRAIHSRNELLEMGLKKGVFGKKTKLNELTDGERNSVSDKLKTAGLSEDELTDVERLQRTAAPLMDFGSSTTKPGDFTQETLRKVRSSATSQASPAVNTQDQKLEVTVRGTVTQRSDGLADLSLEGRGLMDHVNNTVGMV